MTLGLCERGLAMIRHSWVISTTPKQSPTVSYGQNDLLSQSNQYWTPRGPGKWETGPRCWRSWGTGPGAGGLEWGGAAEVIVCHGYGDREGTAIVLVFHLSAQRGGSVRPFPRANGYGAEAVRGGAGCGTPVLSLHATHPNPPDACCLPCLCLLRPLPAPQLNSRPPVPSPLRTPGRCE